MNIEVYVQMYSNSMQHVDVYKQYISISVYKKGYHVHAYYAYNIKFYRCINAAYIAS